VGGETCKQPTTQATQNFTEPLNLPENISNIFLESDLADEKNTRAGMASAPVAESFWKKPTLDCLPNAQKRRERPRRKQCCAHWNDHQGT
jgi:hypothetical protein